eukprot:GEMP01051026.1.p1 GENE.GEMP01051026.1~~GEMP01051026.1.p1  ORF type:complete len:231 (+),score=23.09 GEMP01051026.1:169-861(+)
MKYIGLHIVFVVVVADAGVNCDVYWERQVGALCAIHAMNMLHGSCYFTVSMMEKVVDTFVLEFNITDSTVRYLYFGPPGTYYNIEIAHRGLRQNNYTVSDWTNETVPQVGVQDTPQYVGTLVFNGGLGSGHITCIKYDHESRHWYHLDSLDHTSCAKKLTREDVVTFLKGIRARYHVWKPKSDLSLPPTTTPRLQVPPTTTPRSAVERARVWHINLICACYTYAFLWSLL